MTNKETAKQIAKINREYKYFQIWIYREGGLFDVHTKQNGGSFYSSYGRMRDAARKLLWSGKVEAWQIEYIGYNRETGYQEHLYL